MMFLFGCIAGGIFGMLVTTAVYEIGKKQTNVHKQNIDRALRRPRSRRHFKGY
jgi:hypothetical protein